MNEQFDALSEEMINAMQGALRLIRQSLKLGVQEFADIIGVTRQTVNNLEMQKSQMSVTQFVAICSTIDHYTAKSPQLRQIVYQFLQLGNNAKNAFLRSGNSTAIPLSQRWFSLFENDNEGDLKMNTSENQTVNDNSTSCDIEYLVKNCRIFLDDTILSNPLFETAASELFNLTEQNNSSIIVPSLAQNIIFGRCEKNASDIGISNLKQMRNRRILDVRGEKNDANIAATLISVFAKFKCQYKLALFTDSKDLAEHILSLNDGLVGGNDIMAYCIDPNGRFRSWNCLTEISETDSINDQAISDSTDVVTNDSNGIDDIFVGWDTI